MPPGLGQQSPGDAIAPGRLSRDDSGQRGDLGAADRPVVDHPPQDVQIGRAKVPGDGLQQCRGRSPAIIGLCCRAQGLDANVVGAAFVAHDVAPAAAPGAPAVGRQTVSNRSCAGNDNHARPGQAGAGEGGHRVVAGADRLTGEELTHQLGDDFDAPGHPEPGASDPLRGQAGLLKSLLDRFAQGVAHAGHPSRLVDVVGRAAQPGAQDPPVGACDQRQGAGLAAIHRQDQPGRHGHSLLNCTQ